MIAAAAVLALLPATALAHYEPIAGVGGSALALSALLAASGAGYARGVARLWRKAGRGRGIGRLDALRFVLGWSALALALFSPLDAFADRSFALHMVQHELLMLVAAPLLALSRPLEAWSWALPEAARHALAPAAAGWQRLSAPGTAWTVHAAALWVWHVPMLFGAALASSGLHVLQHACFFFTALLFWRAVFPRGMRDPGAAAIALVFTTMLHSSALGLLLTFAPGAWYAGYMAAGPAPFGLTALEDQQLGGLVMWVVGGFAYVVAGLAVVAAWLSPRRLQRRA